MLFACTENERKTRTKLFVSHRYINLTLLFSSLSLSHSLSLSTSTSHASMYTYPQIAFNGTRNQSSTFQVCLFIQRVSFVPFRFLSAFFTMVSVCFALRSKFNGFSPFCIASSTSIFGIPNCRSIPFHFHIMYLKMNAVYIVHTAKKLLHFDT